MKKQLPIGIQTFAKLKANNDYYYVDKTQKIIELIQTSDFIFLSRPRRFGKSLTLDTIAELFAANKALFIGLYAEQHWDWQTQYPVIRISFASHVSFDHQHLQQILREKMMALEEQHAINVDNTLTIASRFQRIIQHCQQINGQKVVILVDEYDKPILDNLSELETALQIRNQLREFYSVIKDSDQHIRFAMLTGVSKFSKINLFSGLNNLLDITLDKKFSALCGYTQAELEKVFAPELQGVDLHQVKHWYNGYNWGGESVYNPFDILLFLNNDDKMFKYYWVETGNATFLIDTLIHEQINLAQINHEIANNQILSSFEVGDISPIALMFQTGYLTIDKVHHGFAGETYSLKFPNMEIQQSLNQMMLHRYLNKKINPLRTQSAIYDNLLNHHLDNVLKNIQAFFASIPHHWHRNNPIAHYEGYWASVFYALLAGLGFHIITEDCTNHDNIDLTLMVDNHVYIFEFKVKHQHSKTGMALAQIQNKHYADKYRSDGKVIFQIGVEFDEHSREVVFDVQK